MFPFPFVKLPVSAEPTVSVVLTAGETVARASARDATKVRARVGPNSASVPRRQSVAAPSVMMVSCSSVRVFERANESRVV